MSKGDVYGDAIAQCVLKAFDALPASRKPRGSGSGLGPSKREWVPLAGIVIEDIQKTQDELRCVALATGMKCLPQARLVHAHGNVLHDSHAEILAIRAFNRYLLEECMRIASVCSGSAELESSIVEPVQGTVPTIPNNGSWKPAFKLKDSIRIHMYCSEAPCGDASMELIMSRQDDPTPWALPRAEHESDTDNNLHGRGYFSELGVVRRKPSRPDAPLATSKSCSDKLALKQCTSLLSFVTSLLIEPDNVYLETLVLPDTEMVPSAVERAFSAAGRMKDALEFSKGWSGGYRFKPFEVVTTTRRFAYSRIPAEAEGSINVVPSNLAAVKFGAGEETLINGVLQGRKQTDPKGASKLSRRAMWQLALEIDGAMVCTSVRSPLAEHGYGKLKRSDSLALRRRVEQDVRTTSLQGWVSNHEDESWGLGRI